MQHVLYGGDVKPGEKVTAPVIEEVKVYRVKTPGGKYVHVLTNEKPEAVLKKLTAGEKEG